MEDVDIEDEWSFEKEVFGRDPFAFEYIELVHEGGLLAAQKADLDLSKCYACDVGIVRPMFSSSNAHLFADKYPAVHNLHKNKFYVLGFDGYRRNHDKGCVDLRIYLTDNHLTEVTYSHTGLVQPRISFMLPSYLLQTIKTPGWITEYGRANCSHTELAADEHLNT